MHVVRNFGDEPTFWVDCTVDGECSRCGGCCGDFLPLDDIDIKNLKKYIRKHNIKPAHKAFINPQHIDMTCPFRDEKNRSCMVYPARPEICQVFQCDQTREQRDKYVAGIRKNKRMVSMKKVFGGCLK